MKWKAYKNNILIDPVKKKDKVIGDTSKFLLYGKVLDVGEDVSPRITIGCKVCFTQWGFEKVIDDDGSESFFVQDNPDFILAIRDEE